MKKVGGNITATVQIKTSSKNEIGETVSNFTDLTEISGFLDYMSGDSSNGIYNVKLEDTTHIFLCNYEKLPEENEIRLLIKNKIYEVRLIDNPMGMNQHTEIYLKYVGV